MYGVSLTLSVNHAILHELGHYIAARLLNYNAEITKGSGIYLLFTKVYGAIRQGDQGIIAVSGTLFSLAVLLLILLFFKPSKRTSALFLLFVILDASFNLLSPFGDRLLVLISEDVSVAIYIARYVVLSALTFSLYYNIKERMERAYKGDWDTFWSKYL
ncbi:MAG: hypothetical protein QXK42_00450 [Candidatus Korarchaeum sp.]